MSGIQASELILHPDGRLYHIQLKNEDIADMVILVGDQNRVDTISKHFSKIDYRSSHREFIAHTGEYNGTRMTVLSTGIGTDNIDIVLNELDAAVNIDPHTRLIKEHKRSLNIIRLGTSGALQEDIRVNEFVSSSHGLGLDGLLPFYSDWEKMNETTISDAFITHTNWPENFPFPYCVSANTDLLKKFETITHSGITATAPGFYGPQGRQLRLAGTLPDLNNLLTSFNVNKLRITNFEMETSALYGLGKLLGHSCLTVCVIIANRIRKEFTNDYNKSVELLIENCLHKISQTK
jgi:uridine phosphorylase